MAFRERSYVAVPPGERRVKSRSAARLVVRAGVGGPDPRVLLLADTDPGAPGSSWWFTPGGGIDEGETPIEAAVRELEEETGLRVESSQVVGPILTRTVTHGFSDQITVQHETFFAVDVDEPYEISTDGHTPDERVTLHGSRWFALHELASEVVWPRDLASLFVLDGNTCLDAGDVEESTVPL
ncbi:MAG TPA: NUDIX domain-containing protein [Propionibacteriaceae bacterium]|nr:NUDIX domain-containing protein [Propionibacteriaceae bacterium]